MIETVHAVIESECVHRLAETLAHFLWQGAVIYFAVWLLCRSNRKDVRAQYAIGVTGLAAMAVAPMATYYLLSSSGDLSGVASWPGQLVILPPGAKGMPGQEAPLLSWRAAVAVCWMIGVAMLTMRVVGLDHRSVHQDRPRPKVNRSSAGTPYSSGSKSGSKSISGGRMDDQSRVVRSWIILRRLRTHAESVPDNWVSWLKDRARQFRSRCPQLLHSESIDAPLLIGWLRPAILLPTAHNQVSIS